MVGGGRRSWIVAGLVLEAPEGVSFSVVMGCYERGGWRVAIHGEGDFEEDDREKVFCEKREDDAYNRAWSQSQIPNNARVHYWSAFLGVETEA